MFPSMKRSMRPLAGLLCLFFQEGLSSGRAADALDQWTSGVFPKDSHFSSMPGATFGANVIIGGTSFLAAGVVGPSCDCPDMIYTSTDGLNWMPTPGTDYNGVTAITTGDSGLWASNARGIASRIKRPGSSLSSPPGPGFDYFYHDIAFGNGLYVAVGEAWQNTVSTKRTNITYSATGSAWSYALWSTVSAGAPKPRTVAVAFGNGYFLGVGRTNSLVGPPTGTSDLRVSTMTSPSLIIPWTPLGYSPAYAGFVSFPPFTDVAFGSGVFVLAGTNFLVVTNQTFSGNTTVGSLLVTPPTTNPIQKVVFQNGRFMAAAGAEILSSPDGFTWKNHGALATSATSNFTELVPTSMTARRTGNTGGSLAAGAKGAKENSRTRHGQAARAAAGHGTV